MSSASFNSCWATKWLPLIASQAKFAVTIIVCAAVLAAAAYASPAEPPCKGVAIKPGTEIQDVVAAHPPGTTYCVASGNYRLAKTIILKNGDKLLGSRSAVFNGAKLITEWERQGKVWIARGQTQRSPLSWSPKWPEIADPTAQYNEDVFIDEQPLKRVLSLEEVGRGRFFFDYDKATIYIGDDPAGRRVECGATESAIDARAADVVVRGLTIEKYTVSGVSAARRAVIESNELRYVHGSGVRFGSQAKILNNYVHHNGMYGMSGAGEDALVEGNELAFNNAAAYRTKRRGGCWAAGATKFVLTNRLIVRKNYSHDNYCDGFWSDIDNINTVYEDNRIENNYRHGIFLEIGYAATVRNNKISGNMAAGIFVNSSSDQDIYANTIENNGIGDPDNGLELADAERGGIVVIQQNRGSGRHGEHLSKNISVHGNTITMGAGATGATARLGTRQVFSQNVVFDGNRYYVPDPGGSWWSWESGPCTWSQWQAAGQDAKGTVEPIRSRFGEN